MKFLTNHLRMITDSQEHAMKGSFLAAPNKHFVSQEKRFS